MVRFEPTKYKAVQMFTDGFCRGTVVQDRSFCSAAAPTAAAATNDDDDDDATLSVCVSACVCASARLRLCLTLIFHRCL